MATYGITEVFDWDIFEDGEKVGSITARCANEALWCWMDSLVFESVPSNPFTFTTPTDGVCLGYWEDEVHVYFYEAIGREVSNG